jgi:uncharacterized membrane protein YpjA
VGQIIGIFKKIFNNILFLTIIVVINLLGSIIGFYYYYHQLSSSPLYLWPFIPDCPLYTLLVAAILITFILTKKSADMLSFITSIGLAKYGTWTVLVVLGFSQFYFSVDQNMYTALACMHVLMALEFILPLSIMKGIKKSYIVVVFVWFFLNDFFDYYFGTHPPLPYWGVSDVAFMTFLMTPIFIIIAITTRKFLNDANLNVYASAGVAKLGQRRRA